MSRRPARWVAQRAEHLGLGAALTVIAALVSWWAIYAVRLIGTVRGLAAENAALVYAADPGRRDQLIAGIDAAADRQLLMIEGEGGMFVLLLLLSTSFLFLMARRHRKARQRMEHQLLFTTHELKTPIAGLRALLQTLRRGAVPPELLPDLLDQGLHAADRLEHIAETMLACQRVSSGRVKPVVISSAALVDSVLAHRAATGVPERAALELGPETWISADPDAVRVILENLLDNAHKYASGAVRIVGRRDQRSWALAVEDDGPGLSVEDASAIFEPFERRHDTLTHGSGLGLSLSRELARDMGGDLRAEARPRGAVFWLELPLARGPEAAHG